MSRKMGVLTSVFSILSILKLGIKVRENVDGILARYMDLPDQHRI